MTTVVGMFPDRNTTEDAIELLVQNGVERDALGVMWRDKSVRQPEIIKTVGYEDHHSDVGSEAAKGFAGGAIGGATAGAGTMLLASAGVALIPGVGALLAAGTLAATALAAGAGAVGGGATGGLLGALIGATDSDATKVVAEHTRYRTALDRDGFLLTVETSPKHSTFISEVMRKAGALDVSVLEAAEKS